uniref:Uncharacterized protein n=1 Tax=Pseudo-nitzschia australis TaxID=44445 RepID=A0A7S4AUP6_9STRA|mmetsp:Transcript_9139/g.19796  ORF Transcript_9139/g.19796 Transcript_9139/m.19796 type:complete len:567 (-) Transcript_9139:47-1747(-)
MSGETGEMTVEGNSVESGLIWADNPELAYFRSMMTNRMDERVGSGLDGDDSLIRKPTIRGILKVGDDDESNSTRSNSFPLRHIGVRDTSGLNDVETDTVDNIYIEDESILEVNETNDKVLLKDETLEPQDNKEVVLATKITPPERIPYQHQDRIQAANRHSHQQSNNQDTGPLPPLPFQRYSIGEDVVVTKQFPGNIPGMIFVTNGHSSIIETRTHEQSDKHIKKDDKDYCRRKKEKQIWRSLIIFVLAFLVVVATTVAVLVARNERKLSSSNSSSSSSSSSSSLPRPTDESSTISGPNFSPTFAPSSLRANTNQPSNMVSEAPVSSPIIDDLETTKPETSSVLTTEIPTLRPTRPTSPVPTVTPAIPLFISPTIPTLLHPSEEEVKIPSESPSMSSTVPTTFFPKEMNDSLTNPLAIPTSLAAPVTSQPTFFTTSFTSQVATTVNTQTLQDPLTCVSTISTQKNCYENGETMEISFNNCDPTAEDWIGIFPAWMEVSSLRQPLTWLWVCGNQFCNTPVLSGVATLYRLQGFGDFRIFLLRDSETSDSELSAYAVGNEFTISTQCG